MDQVIIYHKTYEQRLEEFTKIFNKFSLNNCNNFLQYWATYLEPLIKHCGWMALWKLSHKVCDNFKITYPTIVLVKVSNVDFTDLECLIEIIAVQTDISLPGKHVVPLIDLWPTKAQQKIINITITANALDAYRFFYTKILMPWDSDNGIIKKWSSKLESRLKLFYDIKNNIIPIKLARNINQYIKDGNNLNEEKNNLEILINNEIDINNNEKKLLEVSEEMANIKTEFKLIEDPFYRGSIINKLDKNNVLAVGSDITYLVLNEITIENFNIIMKKIESTGSASNVHLSSDINESLELCKSNQTILLDSSHHIITRPLAEFLTDINIKGIDKSHTILSGEDEQTIIDAYARIHLENLCLKADAKQSILTLKHISAVLINCLLQSSGKDGIILLSNSQIELINCKLEDCSTAIIGNDNCTIIMKDCDISKVNCGIKIPESCLTKLEDCLFKDCNYGIIIEVDPQLNIKEGSGGFHLLKK